MTLATQHGGEPREEAAAGTRSPAAAAPSIEREAWRERLCVALRGAAVDAGLASPSSAPSGRLRELARRFGLSALELDILAALWVSAFDAELRATLAAREAYSAQLTVRSLSSLHGHAARVRLPSDSPLLLWQMVVEHGLIDGGAALALDPALLPWLEGEHELDRALVGRVALLRTGDALADWPVAATAARVQAAWQQGQPVRVHIVAADALAGPWFAAAVGKRLGLAVLAASAGALRDGEHDALRLQRQAWLDGCPLCLNLADVALARPRGVKPYPLQFLCATATAAAQPGESTPAFPQQTSAAPATTASTAPIDDLADEWLIAGEPACVLSIELPPPGPEERLQLWRSLWPPVAAWPTAALQDLALSHDAGLADIAAAAAAAPADAQQARQFLRARGRGGLAQLARRIDAQFGWDDLILPAEPLQRLHDIAFEARERNRLWAEAAAARLFPYGRGLVALFAGPPGTGKTMAAQVIASELGLDLLAVDLSAIVSKWVGETAQHLQTLLSAPAAQRAVLFFDEADALYAKRVEEVRDAQDRFANLDTSHLMTALEAYPGIVLLASNLKGNIDSAFLRRIRHVVDFPKPELEARLRIWHGAVAALFGPAEATRLNAALRCVARIEATGAQIKNAALSAAFAARQAQQAADALLLGRLLARELAKEGAGVSERELAAMLAADTGSAS
ncbi:ATP-binding protein [Paucibacter sp. APW11]|uniref:ATP-binding protein n=1 Tax=Roseateles aquae TaxID=3077235 RepID=A0ABU3P990_9BURK|nr:ATP-binding protein [Paucibacter sp. APW11]MDT8999141.1 ATP-binding protein [Paucibacter sp. APW11]